MFIRKAYSKLKADFEEVDIFSPAQRSDRSSSQIISNSGSTSSNGILKNKSSRNDLPPFPFESAEDDDDFNGQLPKRNLFQSLQHNASYVSLIATSLSTKSGISTRSQPDSSKLNTTKKKPGGSISSNNSTVPTTYSNHSESSQHLPVDFPFFTSSSNTMNGNGVSLQVKEMPESLSNPKSDNVEVVVYPKVPLSSTFVSHHSEDVPMIQPSVTKTSQSHDDSVTHNNDNLGAHRNTSETNRPDSTPITQPPSLNSKKLPERDIPVVKEISFPKDFVSDKPSTSPSLSPNSTTSTSSNIIYPPLNSTTSSSPNIQSPTLNSTTSTSSNIQNSPLNLTTSISPNIQSPPLTSTTSTSSNIQNSPLNSTTSTSTNIPNPYLSSTTSTSTNIPNPYLSSTTTDSNSTPPKDSNLVRKAARRKSDMNSFLLNLSTPQVVSKEVPEKVQPPKTQPWGPPLRSLQRISESGDSLPSDANGFTPAPEDILARRMGELGRLRRLESRNLLSPTTTTSPKAEVRPQLQTPQEDNSSDVSALLREAYKERQQSLQTQLDKALAELRDVKAENKRLSTENQSQQRSISQLKIALDAKLEQDNSLTQLNNQLNAANSSLTVLNKEKKGWQEKLDSMQDKVIAAERQVRCLDHLTRHKLESRQEAGYGQPKRRGQTASTPASTDVIGAMRALNEEIYQACVQFVEGLERTALFSTIQKAQVQKVLGTHLTAMMEDQAKATSNGYNMLLMQTVLEVFMTHWCSSIIEAFYPKQESFADLLVQLSTQTSYTSGSTAICGKQIKIIQSGTHYDNVKFNEWVKDIIKELGVCLTVAGLKMKTQSTALFTTKTLALVKVAYDLRTAMAEKDICGGLEIVRVPPDTAFQERWMIDAHADHRKVATDQSRVDYVAGTTGLGLQRKVTEIVNGNFQSRMETELKPKVTLAQALKS